MSEKTELGLETSEAERVLDNLDERIEKTKTNLIAAAEQTKEQTEESFKEVMGMMRASYMMVSGVAQMIGGDLGQMVGAMYSIGYSAIQMYSAIATAQFFVPGKQIESAMMVLSLITAMVNLGSIMTGQQELAKRFAGLNMTLQGFSGLLDGMSFS